MPNSIPYPVRDATPYLQLVDERAVYDAGEHFTRMADDVVEEISASLGLSYIGLYTYLTRRVNANGQCTISYARIADDCHTSRRNIIRVAKKLADAGFITITTPPNARTDHLANTFTLPRHRVRTPSDKASDRPSDKASDKNDTLSRDQVEPSKENETGPEKGPLHRAVRSALAEAFTIQSFTKKSLALYDDVTRELVAAGCSPGDVPSLMAWAGRHDYWGKGFGVTQLATIFQQWTAAGQPREKRSAFSYRPWEAQA